jgi:Arc/MetJ family transcription regulator
VALRKTTLTVDDEVLDRVREILGTNGVKDTIDEALARIIRESAFDRETEYFRSREPIDHRELREEAWRE